MPVLLRARAQRPAFVVAADAILEGLRDLLVAVARVRGRDVGGGHRRGPALRRPALRLGVLDAVRARRCSYASSTRIVRGVVAKSPDKQQTASMILQELCRMEYLIRDADVDRRRRWTKYKAKFVAILTRLGGAGEDEEEEDEVVPNVPLE